jgi:biopolymer transport protein ExbB
VFEIFKAGGVLMWPILICSVAATAIVLERFWTLQTRRIAPANLVALVWQWAKAGVLDAKRIQTLRSSSPLGRILAAGLVNRAHDREVMKQAIEDVGRHVVHDLGRFLDTLGTIATISPLLGLLGTVFGMIEVFNVITDQGNRDPSVLAHGISVALITTASGLSVAIPTYVLYRYFCGRVDALVVTMEQEALKMVEALAGERERDDEPAT